MKYASWTGSTWNEQTIDHSNRVNGFNYISLVLDSRGTPHVSYSCSQLESNYTLNYAVWNGSEWNIQAIDHSSLTSGIANSLALDSHGNLHISYINGDLKYATSASQQVGTDASTIQKVAALVGGAIAGAVIVAVALLVVYRKKGLKLEVKGDNTEKEMQ